MKKILLTQLFVLLVITAPMEQNIAMNFHAQQGLLITWKGFIVKRNVQLAYLDLTVRRVD